MLTRVADKKQLVPVALNMHGTRAVQKLIETLSSREQREIVIEALKDGEGEGGGQPTAYLRCAKQPKLPPGL